MKTILEKDTQEAPYCQIKSQWRRLQKLDETLKANHDVCLNSAILLCCISNGLKNQGNIATETGLTPTQASRILSKLETKNLIRRAIGKDDKRQMIFELTDEGQQKLSTITPLGDNYINSL